MLLGKRPRPSIKRTTSMTGITVTVDPPLDDGSPDASSQPSDHHQAGDVHAASLLAGAGEEVAAGGGYISNGIGNNYPCYYNNYGVSGYNSSNNNNNYYYTHSDERFMASMVLSPRNINQNNNRAVETAHFLRTCGLCNRRLAPGRDIYMYRGDTAFCSQECREHQMKQDERREKAKAMASKKELQDNLSSSNTTAGNNKAASTKSETIAAA